MVVRTPSASYLTVSIGLRSKSYDGITTDNLSRGDVRPADHTRPSGSTQACAPVVWRPPIRPARANRRSGYMLSRRHAGPDPASALG